jgi:uncharacterized RDD family membrane protein YckC
MTESHAPPRESVPEETASEDARALEDTVIAPGGTPTPPPPAPAPGARWTGTSLDHYEVHELAGRGGMGAVYVGHDVSLDRRVAIKILPAEVASDPKLQQRFIREARAQAKLQSARVAHIYHIGRTPPDEDGVRSLYFAMEYVPGGSLADRIESGNDVDVEQCRRWMVQAASGLRDAQRAGIVHRDIKPGNLLLDRDGGIKIADFGVAKPMDTSEERLSQHGTVVGSPLYMAPEQAKGHDVDFRADMYALGCSFYHLLAGDVPFDGLTPLAVVSKHMMADVPKLRDAVAEVPRSIEAIIERLMAKDPHQRFASYDALIHALEEAAPTSAFAGFWVRVPASLLDSFLGGLLIGILGPSAMLLHLVYLTVAHAWHGQTLGKYLMSLRVERLDGSTLSLGRSAARTMTSMWMPFLLALNIFLTQGLDELEAIVSRLDARELDAVQSLAVAVGVQNALLSLLYVGGLALAAFHPHKRAAHDLMVGTHVRYALKSALEPGTQGG